MIEFCGQQVGKWTSTEYQRRTPDAVEPSVAGSIKAPRCWSSISDVSKMSVLPVLLLLLCISSSLTQTFQYSQGWTNGRKRSTSATSVTLPPDAALDVVPLPPQLVKALIAAAWKNTLSNQKVSFTSFSDPFQLTDSGFFPFLSFGEDAEASPLATGTLAQGCNAPQDRDCSHSPIFISLSFL